MFKAACSAIILSLFFMISCQRSKTEKSEIAFWNQRLIDSSFRLLYKDCDTTRALHYFDSIADASGTIPVYPKASRFVLKANYYYFFTGQNQATAEMIDSALAMYNSPRLQNYYARTYVGLLLFGGQIAYRLNQYSKANEYYFRAKKLGDAYLSPCERTPFYYNIAMVLYRQQNFLASLNYFEQAYRLQQTCSPQTTAVVLQQQEIQDNIGLCYIQLKNDDSAQVHFGLALQIADQYRDSLGPVTMDKIYGVVYGNQAKLLMNKNRLDEAEKLSLKSIALNDRKGYEEEYAQAIKLQLADIYSRKKDLSSMFAVLKGMRDRMEQAGANQQLEWKRLMAAYYEQRGQHDSALGYLKNYFSLNDSIDRAQKLLTAADVTRQLTEKEQETQIAILRKDNELALASLAISIIISCMAIAIVYLIYTSYRRNKKNLLVLHALNKEIKNQKEAREEEARLHHKRITEAVIRAQENERSAIGLELHDNINQVLTTVKLHNEMVLDGLTEPQMILPSSINYLQNCINEIRSLSKRLSAPTLGKINLQESVKDLIESINETSKVRIRYQITGLTDTVIKKELHLGVYRILQEQLNNILKHSEASEVAVQLEQRQQAIHLLVSDNGKGFLEKNSKRGLGLLNMRTRAESLNGTFELESHTGGGCKIKVVLPCLQ